MTPHFGSAVGSVLRCRQHSSEHLAVKEHPDKSSGEDECVVKLRSKSSAGQQARQQQTRLHAHSRQDRRRCQRPA